MDLWVRNQDNTALVKVDNVYINPVWQKEENGEVKINEHWSEEQPETNAMKMFGVYANGTRAVFGVLMGTYATQQRAIEVLDEIQKRIMGSHRVFIDIMPQKENDEIIWQNVEKSKSSIEHIHIDTMVYEMPKE